MSDDYVEIDDEVNYYAGFWRRFVALILDSILLSLVMFPLMFLLYGKGYLIDPAYEVNATVSFLINKAFPVISTLLFWVYFSATPGKILLGIKIIDAKTGNAPSFIQFVFRYIGYVVSAITLCLGFLWVAWDSKKQGFHDKIAGTAVVKTRR